MSTTELTFNNIFIDDDPLVLATRDMNAVGNFLHQLPLD